MKSKVINKKGIIHVVYKAEKGQQINEPELQILRNGIPGLLPMQIELFMKKYRLTYDVTGYITLKDFLVMPLNSKSLCALLKSVLETLKSMERAYLRQENIVFDTERIYINAMQQSVNYIYMPVRFYETERSLREFLLDIVEYGSFDKNEDNTYVKEYIKILNEGMTFSVFDLEEYVKKLEKNDFQDTNKQIQCSHCKTFLSEKTKFCPNCGTKVGGIADDTNDDVYDPLGNRSKKRIENENKIQRRETDIAEKESGSLESGTQGLSDESTLMDEDYNQTMMLTEVDFLTEYNPCLVRVSNKERIRINKYEFRIGKKKTGNDYVVDDNNVVSGKHAIIVIHDEKVYIMDDESRNGTKLNGVRIEPQKEYRLSNNDKIKLANEEFIFSIEE